MMDKWLEHCLDKLKVEVVHVSHARSKNLLAMQMRNTAAGMSASYMCSLKFPGHLVFLTLTNVPYAWPDHYEPAMN